MTGIEPVYKGFADPCLTTWRHGRVSFIPNKRPLVYTYAGVFLVILLEFLRMLLLLFRPSQLPSFVHPELVEGLCVLLR